MRRILVLRGGALGDFIVTLPALAALRQRWPTARIELAGNATAAALALARGLLDAAHSQHQARWSRLFDAAPLPAEFSAWLAHFDLVINYWPDAGGELRSHFPMPGGQMFLTADAMPSCAPAATHYASLLAALGITEAKTWFSLAKPLPQFPVAPVSPQTPQPTIYVHPGSGSPQKNWPLANWRALVPHLPAPVTVILGEAEREGWAGAAPALGCPENAAGVIAPQILVQPPLEELVSRLAHCALFLGHDSGISHLAAAAGARCLLLFGPTDAAVWAPPAPNVQVLQRGPDLNAISVDAVREAVASALADRS